MDSAEKPLKMAKHTPFSGPKTGIKRSKWDFFSGIKCVGVTPSSPGMEKVEVQRIAGFLSDVYEGICEGDDTVTMQQQLTELYRVKRCYWRVWNTGHGSISRR